MKDLKKVLLLLSAMLLVFIAGCSGANDEGASEQDGPDQMEETVDEEVIAVAEKFIEQLNGGDYDAATENFDEAMKEQLDAEGLKELWESLISQLGDYVDSEYDETQEVEGFQVVLFKGVFNDKDVTLQVTVDADKKIAGFFVR